MQKYLQNLTPLKTQGYCNKVFLSIYKDEKFILKELLNQDINKKDEIKVQNKAYKKRVSEKIISFNDNYILYRYIDGIHKQKLRKKDIYKLSNSLKRFHTIKIRSKKMDLKKLLPLHKQTLISQTKRFRQNIKLTHNDLNPKNILFTNDKVKFIDFEYSINGDIYFDLGAICVEFKLNRGLENYLLRTYFKKESYDLKKLKLFKKIYKNSVEYWFKKFYSQKQMDL